ncbi:HIT family protein [Corynebacterium argentoratense]|uniref:HIT family protein n=1 Tax=Corynebacterium argentoratense TaxID=42817 RepID=UPI001F3A684D|nr:HIT domain-containing protein [Corynebacterium argentoratense]MCF1764799.1 HIT domain-containing protein [Corynebacterium argentoratense]
MSTQHRHSEPQDPQRTVVDCGLGTPDRLERLWAPYRMDYIAQGAQDRDKESSASRDPFIEVPKLSDEDGLIVARGQHVYCVLNLYPYNPGHMLIVPYRKVSDLEDLSPEESAELMAYAQKAVRVIKQVSNPNAINVGLNLGKAAGGSVADHLHMHIVPRWVGDANFMTVIDSTKVLPQRLRDTRSLFAEAWKDLSC